MVLVIVYTYVEMNLITAIKFEPLSCKALQKQRGFHSRRKKREVAARVSRAGKALRAAWAAAVGGTAWPRHEGGFRPHTVTQARVWESEGPVVKALTGRQGRAQNPGTVQRYQHGKRVNAGCLSITRGLRVIASKLPTKLERSHQRNDALFCGVSGRTRGRPFLSVRSGVFGLAS